MGDALSTALFCMDIESGMALIESIEGAEAMWLLPNGKTEKTSGFPA
jgi:thiamine biosynthesis lipoprotein